MEQRLIDANALKKVYEGYISILDELNNGVAQNDIDILHLCIRQIDNAPTVGSMPTHHGEWLEVGYGKPDAWDCSACDAMVSKKTNYCPRCGARMLGRGPKDA